MRTERIVIQVQQSVTICLLSGLLLVPRPLPSSQCSAYMWFFICYILDADVDHF